MSAAKPKEAEMMNKFTGSAKRKSSQTPPFILSGNGSAAISIEQTASLIPLIIWAAVKYSSRVFLLCIISAAVSTAADLAARLIIKFAVKSKSDSAVRFDIYPIFIGLCAVCMLPYNVSAAALIIFDLLAIALKYLADGIISPLAAARTVMIPITANFGASFFYSDSYRMTTPLSILSKSELPDDSLTDMFLGRSDGMTGEISALLILLCMVYLLVRGHIRWETPVAAVGAAFLVAFEFAPDSVEYYLFAISEILCGGLLFGAVFIASDKRRQPVSMYGRLIYGALIGALAMVIRLNGDIDGIYPAVALLSPFTPLIDRFTATSPFGGYRRRKNTKKNSAADNQKSEKAEKSAENED